MRQSVERDGMGGACVDTSGDVRDVHSMRKKENGRTEFCFRLLSELPSLQCKGVEWFEDGRQVLFAVSFAELLSRWTRGEAERRVRLGVHSTHQLKITMSPKRPASFFQYPEREKAIQTSETDKTSRRLCWE